MTTIEEHPAVERYLAALRAGLGELSAAEREEIAHEIQAHVAEARAAGRGVDEALRSLGPADALARAYAVELLLNRRPGPPGLGRWFRLLVVLAATGLPSLVLIPMLLTVGLVLVVHERQAPLVDPDTGRNLGAPERLVGELEVVSVEPRFSVARPRSGTGFARGQVARPAEGR